MTNQHNLSRRQFVRGSAAMLAAGPLLSSLGSPAAAAEDHGLKDRMYKTLKIGMVNVPGDLATRFAAAKAAGFHGIEMDSPGMNVEETIKASRKADFPVDGTVISTHWSIRHSSPDAEQRATALEHLKNAIRDTHAVGGNTALLVVGHGDDGPEDEIWPRSIENIAKAIPVAAEYGVYIAIENVWNKFLYDHDGPADQTADKFAKYVDEFNSPWVGMQFDIGNHWKYGSPGAWIRTLGKRIVKLDVKGFSRKDNRFTKIGAGDLPWGEVREALSDIGFAGWVAAEVGGGNADRLQEVSDNMDKAFGLG